MILLVSIGVAIILLAILIFAIPLRLSLKGRGVILASSVIVGITGLVAIQVLSIWQVILYPFLLSIIFSYLIIKKLDLTQEPEVKTPVNEEMKPAFSFVEQVEKAKAAETIDEYYDTAEIPIKEIIKNSIPESVITNTDIDGVERPSAVSPQAIVADIETPNIEMINLEISDVEKQSNEMINLEKQSQSNIEGPITELEEFIPLDVEMDQKNGELIKEIEELTELSHSPIDISSDLDDPEIDFEKRDLSIVDESSNRYVEQSIASTMETEEERLMESRRRLFQSNDQDRAELVEKTDVSTETESIEDRNMIEKQAELNDGVRIQNLNDISEFTTSLDEAEKINGVARIEGLEDISHSAGIDDVEEINGKVNIEKNFIGNIENLEEIRELSITDEELAESKQKRADEHREKQQMYQEKVLAQFEDLEEIYLRKKQKIRNKEEL